MKLKPPPIPTPPKQPNKNPGSSAKVSSSKTAVFDGHLAGHEATAKAVSAKNRG